MHEDFSSGSGWQQLVVELQEAREAGQDVRPVLDRWLPRHRRHVEEVQQAGHPDNHGRLLGVPEPGAYTTSQRLYALGRVLDVLLVDRAPRADLLPPGLAPAARAETFPAFCASLGATPIDHRPFHPFFHEVVEVVQSDDPDEAPTILEERWPGHLMDAMVLVRTGVVVRAGAHHLVHGVADRSTLYWTFLRPGRPTEDLSSGWGSRSQWTTGFRRDYLVDGLLHYNVDEALGEGKHVEPDEIDAAAMTGIVRHRCSTVVHHGDVFPYDAHHVEPAPR